MVVRCVAKNGTEAWYNANKAQIFADFGSLYSAQMSIDGIDARTGEAYDDMVLVKNEATYTRSGEYVIIFTYETLTDSFVKETEDTVDFDLNGLKRLTRTIIAKDSTAYASVVGTTKLGSAPELTLAEVSEDQLEASEDGFKRIQEVWLEPGTLRVSTRNLSEGVREVTKEFLITEGTTVGPVISRTTDNFEGLKTITVTTLQDKAGGSIIGSGENLVNQYSRQVDFTYPGVVSIRQDVITSDVGVNPNILNFELTPPVQTKLTGTVSVIFQSSASIVSGDFVYNDNKAGGAASGYWNPDEWARTYVSGIGHDYLAFSTSKGLRGYRTNPSVSGITTVVPTGASSFVSNGVTVITGAGTSYLDATSSTTPNTATLKGVADTGGNLFVVDGRRLYHSTPFLMEVSGGPDDPSGDKLVLDVDLRPAFEDVSGTQYYKKTIVTATA
jgi:hypothetical protein